MSCLKNFSESHIINPLLTKLGPSRWLDTGLILSLRVYGPRLRLGPAILTSYVLLLHCAVPENIHTHPQKGLEFPGGWGFWKAKKFKEMYEA